MFKMDELDKELVKELQEKDALTPKVTEIAKKLGKSTTTIHSRIKRLERQGIVQGYKAVIDAAKVGKNHDTFYFIKTARSQGVYVGDIIAEKLVKNPHVKKVYNTMGEWDLMVEFLGKDSDEYVEFMKSIEPLEGIRETKGKYILKTYPSKFKVIPD